MALLSYRWRDEPQACMSGWDWIKLVQSIQGIVQTLQNLPVGIATQVNSWCDKPPAEMTAQFDRVLFPEPSELDKILIKDIDRQRGLGGWKQEPQYAIDQLIKSDLDDIEPLQHT